MTAGEAAQLARHDLVGLTEDGWSALAAERPALATWALQRHPVVVRRVQPGDDPALVSVAVALPPSDGAARVASQVAVEDIASAGKPPLLGRMLPKLPAAWRSRAGEVLGLADRLEVWPRVFGSAMWQFVTGLAYLREGSDLDLIWPVGRDVRLVAELVAGLDRIDARPGPRIDGEIVLDGIGAVNWRELAAGAVELLVKTRATVRMMPRDALAC